MANGSITPVIGQAAVWLSFGNVLIRHCLFKLIADVVTTMLGCNFFQVGEYGSSLFYKSGLFAATGDLNWLR
jgi:hypothetical protein